MQQTCEIKKCLFSCLNWLEVLNQIVNPNAIKDLSCYEFTWYMILFYVQKHQWSSTNNKSFLIEWLLCLYFMDYYIQNDVAAVQTEVNLIDCSLQKTNFCWDYWIMMKKHWKQKIQVLCLSVQHSINNSL